MWLIHMHKSCYCPSIPESSSQPSASVFFGPVSGGGLEKIRLLYSMDVNIYIYLLLTEKEKMIVSFWTTKALFVWSPSECFADSHLIHFCFKALEAHELGAGLIPTQNGSSPLPAFSKNSFQSHRVLALRRPKIIAGFISILQCSPLFHKKIFFLIITAAIGDGFSAIPARSYGLFSALTKQFYFFSHPFFFPSCNLNFLTPPPAIF